MALGVELYALPLGFMAREVALSVFWMLQGSKQPLGPPPSHGGATTQPQQPTGSQCGRDAPSRVSYGVDLDWS